MNSLNQKKYAVYCGIDFHKVNSVLCTLDANGNPYPSGSGITTVKSEQLAVFLSNKKDWLIGIEATGGANFVVAKLKDLCLDVVIINPNKFRGIAIGGKKTDKRDATALANALRLGYIPTVYHKSQNARELKSILTLREQWVMTRSRAISSIRGTLREYGVTIPVGVERFYEDARAAIMSLKNEGLKELLITQFELVLTCKKNEREAEEIALGLVKEDQRFELLKTIPGIGNMSAMMMIAVVDDISRFKNSREFASYLGLVPSVSASANRCMMGSITRSGSEMLRRYLIHGARAWMKYNPKGDPNRIWAENVKSRRGVNKSTVALAHRIARISFAVLRDLKPYQAVSAQKQLDMAS